MTEETERIWETAQELAIDLRTAAYVHALSRLGESIRARGTRDDYIK